MGVGWCIHPNNPVSANQKTRLSYRVVRLQAHRCVHDVMPSESAAHLGLYLADTIRAIAAAQAEYADPFARDVEAREHVHERYHDGVIGPHAAIDEPVSSVFHGGIVGRGGGRGCGYLRRWFMAIQTVIGMMRCFEYVRLPVAAVRTMEYKDEYWCLRTSVFRTVHAECDQATFGHSET